MQATSFTFRPLAAHGIGFFQSSRATELSGTRVAPRDRPRLGGTRVAPRDRPGLGDLGFLDSIINAAAGVATGIANAFAAGSVADSQQKQAAAIAQSNADIAASNAQAAMYNAQARAESIKAAAPWVGAAIIGGAILVSVLKK